jgi:hypothetical protein
MLKKRCGDEKVTEIFVTDYLPLKYPEYDVSYLSHGIVI